MGQRQAAFGHHLHQVSQAQLEAKIPAHAQDDDLAVEVATLEQLLDAHQLAHAHPSGSSADIIASQILPFAPEPCEFDFCNINSLKLWRWGLTRFGSVGIWRERRDRARRRGR